MSDSTAKPQPFQFPLDEDDYILSDKYDGSIRKMYRKFCSCGNEFFVPKHKYYKVRYCSISCASKAKQNRETIICANCQQLFERPVSDKNNSKTGTYFCSRRCKDEAQGIDGIEVIQPPHYKDGVSSYRARAFKYYGAKCSICGYSEHPLMLDVDHIDSDRSNNKLDNLQVLCVWCHALKTRGVPYHERKPV